MIPVLLGLLTLPHAPPAQVGISHTSKVGRFTATFPTTVTERTSGEGAQALVTAVAEPSPGRLYSVTVFDLAAGADEPAATLARLARRVKGRVLSERAFVAGPDRLPARETVYELTDLHLRQVLVLKGRRLYTVHVAGPGREEVTGDAPSAFLASFRPAP